MFLFLMEASLGRGIILFDYTVKLITVATHTPQNVFILDRCCLQWLHSDAVPGRAQFILELRPLEFEISSIKNAA
jgi:hypothetical protein